ncbi:MAG: glycosyltransferase family 4 protein [Bacteroidota bacterium]
MAESKLNVSFVEPIGGHRGNDFYDFGLCKALSDQQVELTFYTCDETNFDTQFSFGFETNKIFDRIYGADFILLRGWRYFKASLKTIADAKRKKASLVHLHIYHFAWREFFLLWLFRRNNFKVVATIHDVEDFRKFGDKINYRKYFKFEKRIDHIIVHSDFAKSSIEKYFSHFPKSHIHKVPHGDTDFLFTADCSRQQAREKLNLPTDRQLILFFGQIKKVKGLDVLINAFAQLRNQNANAMLLVAGPVWKVEAEEFFNIIREYKMEKDCVLRLEYIASELVPYYFRAANIVALPYRKIYSSGVLIRSLDYASAIVASDLDVFKDIITNGENGILFASENATDLAEKMQHLLADENLQEKLSANAKRTANEKFSWKLIGEKVKAIYSLALNEK